MGSTYCKLQIDRAHMNCCYSMLKRAQLCTSMHSIRVQVSVQTPDHMYGLQGGTLVQALPQSRARIHDKSDATCDGTSLPPLLSFDPQPYSRDL